MSGPSSKPLSPDGISRLLTAGIGVVILLAGCVGVWAAVVGIAGAVVATGTVTVDSNLKKVQHPSGGIVGSIHVKDGDRVSGGDLLVRLDETLTRANLEIVSNQLSQLSVREARLRAELEDKESIDWPPLVAGFRPDHEARRAEETLFRNRKHARNGQMAQLSERMIQLREQVAGTHAQLKAKADELELIATELAAQKAMWERKLTSIAKYSAVRREAVRLEGEKGQLIAANAQNKARIAETELQILQVNQDMKAEVSKELREMQARLAELQERRIAAQDHLARIEIRAPIAGIVHQLSVHTIGGVISPGEAILLIVPENDARVIEAKVAPQHIDQVRKGQPAFIRFVAFNLSATPEFAGRVERVAADLTRDPQTGQTYYVARVVPDDMAAVRAAGLELLPGMPAEVHLLTGERTMLSYLIKPLSDQIGRTFKER